VALLLVVACGAFVAAEFALVTVSRPAVEQAAESGDVAAQGVLASLRNLSTQLSAAQIGITITNLLIGFLAEPSIAKLIDGPLEALGIPSGAVSGVSIAIALVIATGVTMLFGELVPKNLAIAHPLATARAVQGFQRRFARAASWLISATNGTANALLRRLGIEPQEELASARSPEELSSLVRRSARQGTLDIDTARLVERSLAFGERRAADVLTPWGSVHEVRAEDPVSSVVEAARATGRSRFPVGRGVEIAGIVHLRQAVAVPHDRRGSVTVAEIMGPPLLVPESLDLDTLLQQLRDGGVPLAIVVDEFGNVDGIVTLEDLIEELVGEVRDEHDAREDAVVRETDSRWLLSGLIRPDEVGHRMGIVLPEDEDYETIGGLLAARLHRLPTVGSSVEVEARDAERRPLLVTLTVVDMDGLRVNHVRLELAPGTA
jgi:CBS domain containing-hemolysin-like protein